MRRLLRLALLVAILGALAYLLGKRPTPAPAAAPSRPAPRPTTAAAPPVPAAPTGGIEPEVTEVGDLDTRGEPELDTGADGSERVSDTDVTTPPAKKAAPRKAAAKKAAPAKKAAAKKAAVKKAAPAKQATAKKAAPPVDPPVS